MKFTINRTAWLRGEGSDKSFLIRMCDGKQCCLGFLGLACGYDIRDLLQSTTPVRADVVRRNFYRSNENPLPCEATLWPKKIIINDEIGYTRTDITDHLMAINDKRNISDSEREEKLTELFESIGIEVEFIG